MKEHGGFEDWEILLGSEAVGEDLKPLQVAGDVSFADAIKTDYFALDCRNPCQDEAALAGITHMEKGEEEVGHVDCRKQYQEEAALAGSTPTEQGEEVGPANSNTLFRADPDSRVLDCATAELGFPGVTGEDLSEPCSNELCNGQGFRSGGESEELDDAGGLEIGENADGDGEGDEEVGVGGTWGVEGSGMEFEKSVEEDSVEHVKVADESYKSSVEMSGENVGSDKVLAPGGKRGGVAWWKLPLEFLEFFASKVKPRWSMSIYLAAAILGIWLLRKRMYRTKPTTQSVPFKISLDEKKTSQLKLSAARLNEAFIVMKRVPTVRASLSAGSVNPRSVLSLQ